MKHYQECVVVEKDELSKKVIALRAFIQGELFKTIPDDEQSRLRWQLMLMNAYCEVLVERIDQFEQPSIEHD